MQDGDKDGVYEFATDGLADRRRTRSRSRTAVSWDENYGVGGAPGGANYTFTATDGQARRVPLHARDARARDHRDRPAARGHGRVARALAERGHARRAGDLRSARAIRPDCTYTLEHSPDATLAVADGEVTGGDEPIELEPRSRRPHRRAGGEVPAARRLRGRSAPGRTRARRGGRCCSPSSSGSHSALDGELTAFTGVQLPGVLDDLYADALASTPLGATVTGQDSTVRLWAPTAQSVSLEVWDVGRDRRPCGHPRRVRRDRRHLERRRPLGGRRVPLVGRGLRADDGQDRDQLGHRPVLGRAHDELGALGRS